jgi:hypothetical protein
VVPPGPCRSPAACGRKIKRAIREEAELQGGQIGDDSLDFQVNVFTWGEDKYELANFSNEELLPALTQLAQGQDVGAEAWLARVTRQLQDARRDHEDIECEPGSASILPRRPCTTGTAGPA